MPATLIARVLLPPPPHDDAAELLRGDIYSTAIVLWEILLPGQIPLADRKLRGRCVLIHRLRERDRQTERERETDRQTDRQADRPTDRQTDIFLARFQVLF